MFISASFLHNYATANQIHPLHRWHHAKTMTTNCGMRTAQNYSAFHLAHPPYPEDLNVRAVALVVQELA